MATTQYASAISILNKIAEDDRNWRAGMAQIGELLNAAQSAQAVLSDLDKRKAAAEAAVASIEAQRKAAEASFASSNEHMLSAASESKRLDRELETRKSTLAKYGHLEDLDAQIKSREGELATLTKAVADVKARFA